MIRLMINGEDPRMMDNENDRPCRAPLSVVSLICWKG